ncbi:NUDIX hydrolase domain-like protein [Dipodascopsis uninucleata]
MHSYLDLVAKVDSFPYSELSEINANAKDEDVLYEFITHDKTTRIGLITAAVVAACREAKNIFLVNDVTRRVYLVEGLDTFEKRTASVNEIAAKWREESRFKILSGWRNEQFAIYYPNSEVYMTLERSACPLFGVICYGIHLTAYIPANDKIPMKIWVPRRANTKPTYPGMLDNSVAGGLGYPYGVFETVIKECSEEAGFAEELVRSCAVPVGVLTYFSVRNKHAGGETDLLEPECEYCYDLCLEDDSIKPWPVDGEAQEFHLWDIDTVKAELMAGNFKSNTALVMIDFFIRHGIITPENEPDYLEIVSRMHRNIGFPHK